MATYRPKIDGEYGTTTARPRYTYTQTTGGKKVTPRQKPRTGYDAKDSGAYRTIPTRPPTRTGFDAKDSAAYRPIPTSMPQSGGGGYTSGSGGYGSTPTATMPTTAAAPPAPAMNLADLEAALAALEAKYGLSREQLLSDQTEAGDQFRYVLTMLHRSRQDALRGSTNQAIGRGVLRSGLYLSDQSRIANEFAAQRAQEEAAQAARLRAIQESLAQLELQLQQDKVGAAQEAGYEDLERAQAAAQAY